MEKDINNSNGGHGINGSPGADKVIQLGGRAFRKVELGLDEKEVRSYIEEIIGERDSLSKRQVHLSALAALAEKTVIEANNIAQQTKQKAEEQAKAEAEKIRVKAEQDGAHIVQEKKAEAEKIRVKAEQDAAHIVQEKKTEAEKIRVKAEQEASHIIQEQKAEAKVQAEKEAETIKTQAQKQIEAMREERLNILKVETKSLAEKLQSELLSSIENIKRQVMTFNANLENMSSISNSAFPATSTATATKPVSATPTVEKGTTFDHIPWLEIEVLPPVDIGKIMDLISRLEDLPVVKTTDLLPEMPNPLIRVFLNEPSPLAELLRTLPQVKQVTEVADFETALDSDMPTGNKKERIQIVLEDQSRSREKESKKNSVAQPVSR